MLARFWNRAKAAPPAPAEPTVRDSIFSTGHDRSVSRLSLVRRHEIAMRKSFQVGVETVKSVAGEQIDYAMDEAYGDLTQAKIINSGSGYLPIVQLEWYANQGFIGWNLSGVLSQNWLIDKACGVPAQDAIRNGYEVTLNDGEALDPDIANRIRLLDKKFKLKGQCREFVKKSRIFGIRHALFLIDGIDYSAPFNPDGITPGSYKGISQIDPYWITPELDSQAAADPMSKDFYEPTWWRVGRVRIHKSHFIITRNGDDVVDMLKPSYFYGGISIPQKIFERVYAAERTANEAPMLALSKRLTTLKTDTTKIFGPNSGFNVQMEEWAALQNNFGIKVVGLEDEVQQFDTNLASFDETIMTQYQLVAAASNVPATKLLGTSPKGFNATGEYDEASYHEELESIQEHILTPFVERHHLCQMRSIVAPKYNGGKVLETEITWKPTDSYTTKELAEINKMNAETDNILATAGSIDGLDIRHRITKDPNSNYTGIPEVVPNGPGDREHEQEVAEQLLESSSAPQESKTQKRDQVEA